MTKLFVHRITNDGPSGIKKFQYGGWRFYGPTTTLCTYYIGINDWNLGGIEMALTINILQIIIVFNRLYKNIF